MRDEFIQCGFTQTEYDILIHLLARGTRSAGAVANSLKVKRSTVYSALESLERRGLIRREKSGSVAEFSPIETSEIPSLLAGQARTNYERVLSAIDLIKPRIERFSSGKQFHAGELEIIQVDNTHEYVQLLSKYILFRDYTAIWNPQVAIYSPEVKKRMQQFLKETAKNKNKIKDILIDGPLTQWYLGHIKNPNHQVRIIKDEDPNLADLIVVDDSVILSLNSPESESAVQIKNAHYASFMRWYFMNLWDRLA